MSKKGVLLRVCSGLHASLNVRFLVCFFSSTSAMLRPVQIFMLSAKRVLLSNNQHSCCWSKAGQKAPRLYQINKFCTVMWLLTAKKFWIILPSCCLLNHYSQRHTGAAVNGDFFHYQSVELYCFLGSNQELVHNTFVSVVEGKAGVFSQHFTWISWYSGTFQRSPWSSIKEVLHIFFKG